MNRLVAINPPAASAQQPALGHCQRRHQAAREAFNAGAAAEAAHRLHGVPRARCPHSASSALYAHWHRAALRMGRLLDQLLETAP